MSVFSSSVGLSHRVLTDGWRHKNWVNSRDKGMSDLLTAWPLPPCSSGRSCKVGWLVLIKLSQKICVPAKLVGLYLLIADQVLVSTD